MRVFEKPELVRAAEKGNAKRLNRFSMQIKSPLSLLSSLLLLYPFLLTPFSFFLPLFSTDVVADFAVVVVVVVAKDAARTFVSFQPVKG